jgi:archaeosine-15-forming tRNA-guanine transglycosylase
MLDENMAAWEEIIVNNEKNVVASAGYLELNKRAIHQSLLAAAVRIW